MLIAGAIAGAMTLAVAPSAPASVLNVRGDTDEIQSGVTSVSSNFPNSSSSAESVSSLSDRNASTKWYAGTGNQPTSANPIYVIYTLSAAAQATAYSITSGNDAPERDPKAWTILGSNTAAAATDANDASWTVIDTQTGQSFAARNQRSVYSTTASTSYKYYQLRVTANLANNPSYSSTAGDNAKFQIADWTLRSGVAGYPSTIVTSATAWSYLEDGSIDPANGAANRTAWTQVGATLPGTWKTAAAPFGAKNGSATPSLGANFPVTTVLKYYLNGTTTATVPAYFFRYAFELDQAGLDSIKGLYGTLVHDDAATVYVNGTAVADFPGTNAPTSNLGYGGNNNGDPATEQLTVPSSSLQVGQNVISVELHNVNATSSDVYFSMPTLAATSDAVAAPFTSAETGATYPSSTVSSDFFTKLLSGFDDVKTNSTLVAPNSSGPNNSAGATLSAANDRVVVAVNQGAAGSEAVKVAKRAQATYDSDNSSYIAMTDALGGVLGPIYRTALQTGELPKTKWLLDNVENSSYEAANNAAKSAYGYKRPMNRLGFTSGGTCSGGSFTGTTGWIAKNYPNSYDGLCGQGSFPSGHTLHGYTSGTTMATLLPELAPQFLYRASEYGNNRIVLGFHYPMDVMSGRMIGQASVANRWSDAGFRNLLTQATAELRTVLGQDCHELGYSSDIVECAEAASDFESDAHALQTYTDRTTYAEYSTTDGVRHTDGFPVIDPEMQDAPVKIPDTAPALLLSTFPNLSDAQRAAVLKATAVKGGYALDKTKDGEASWQRINLAAAMSATVSTSGGQLTVNGINASDSRATSLSVDGAAVPGFTSGTTTYNVKVSGTSASPVLSAVPAVTGASVSVSAPGSIPGTGTVTVTSLDGAITTYTVNFSRLGTDASLASIQIGGQSLAGFTSAQTAYTVTLPAGTTAVPQVSAVTTDTSALAPVITQATSVTGTATIQVTSEDGSTTRTYTVEFKVAAAPAQPVVAGVSASAKATIYGAAAAITVKVSAAGTVPSGQVYVKEGSRTLASVALSGGQARVTLPKTLAAGKHSLRVVFVPQAGSGVVNTASDPIVVLTVAKAKAKVTSVKITKGKKSNTTIRRGGKATIKVSLAGVGVTAPSGTVTVKVGAKTVGKSKVKRSGKKYIATVKTKKLTKKGKVSVSYSGNTNLAKATYKTKIQVR